MLEVPGGTRSPLNRARLRSGVATAVVLAAVATFVAAVHEHYPIQQWLFWRYAAHWGAASVLALSCWLSGAAALRRFGVVLPRGERVVLQLALGLYLFYVAMFLGGILNLYGQVFALAMPLGLAAVGWNDARRHLRRYAPIVVRAFRRPVRFESPLALAIVLFGLAGAAMVYLPVLTPDNVAADARWYHLTLADHYAAQGGIARTPEGSFVAAYPQLATVVYTWAFLLPRTELFDRIEIAAHLEFMIFLWTLAGVGVLAQRLVPQCRARLAWAAVFLFPGIFLYDSNLSVAADHVLAFWAAPIFLALLRAWPELEPRRCLVLAAVLAGAALTKYQAGCLVVIPVLALLGRAVFLSLRRRRLSLWAGPVFAGALALVLTAPHWAKNAIWYHDPLYPLLHEVLPDRPWSADASRYFERIFRANMWTPKGTLSERLEQTGKALFTFSFKPNDWFAFHGAVPVFGSLFTLTSFSVPLLGRQRRLWALVGTTYGAVFIWYWGSHQDRYLQAVLPWMAAATAATLVKLWHSGAIVRVATTALVGLQIVWGGDVPFIPTHAFIGTTPYKTTIDLMSTGYRRDREGRLHPFGAFWNLGRQLPPKARVLVHGDLGPLGLGAAMISDMTGWQGGVSYGRQRSSAELHRLLGSLRATHVLWMDDWAPGNNSIADDLVFYGFVHQYLDPTIHVGRYHIAEVPAQVPPEQPLAPVLVWTSGQNYARGLHDMAALTVPGAGPRSPHSPAPLLPAKGNEAELVKHAGYVVLERAVAPEARLDGFTRILRRDNVELWARDRSAPAPVPLP
jgi:hypothetical protein